MIKVFFEVFTEIAKISTPLVLLALAIMQWKSARAAAKRGEAVQKSADQAAQEVKEVKSTLLTSDEKTTGKLDDLAKNSEKIHTLVNSNMGTQLKISAGLARELADLTGTDHAKRLADEYESLVKDHEAKQSIVDHVLTK